MEPSEIIGQREPTERELGNAREMRHISESVMTSSSSSTAVVEIRLTRNEEIVHAHDQGVQVPTPDDGLSSLSTHTDEFIERTIMPNIIPKLDGPASVRTQRRQPLPMTRRTTLSGDGFPEDSDSGSRDHRSHDNRRYPGSRYQ